MIQVRNVPEDLHRKLKTRAAVEGIVLSDLVLRELRRAVAVTSSQELSERLAARVERPYGGETAG